MGFNVASIFVHFRKIGQIIGLISFVFFGHCSLKATSGSEDRLTINPALLPNLAQIFSIYSPYVVKVLYKSGDQMQVGSGFFISDNGYILTSIMGGESFSIETHCAQQFTAQKVGEDRLTAISLLKADLGKLKVPFFSLVSAIEYPQIGQYVVSLSCKLGSNISPQLGYVTGLNERYFLTEFPMLVVRSSLSIDGGDCGGAVMDDQGRFLGMLSHAVKETHETFFIPQVCLYKVFQDLLLWGRVRYSYAGLNTTLVFDTKTEEVFLKVTHTQPSSPAEVGGFLPDDIIISVEGSPIHSLGAFKNLIFLSTPGEYLTFTVLRGEKTVEIRLKLGEK